jgi:predicted PhzF superfamily epimerase YddE/YHI9
MGAACQAREMNLSETGFLLPDEDGDVADAARRMADTPQRDTPVGPRLVRRQGH